MRLIDNTVNLNELETFNIEIKGNKRIRTYYFINTFQQANNIMVEILNAININWKMIDPYKQEEGIKIMKRLQEIQNLIYNIMETTTTTPIQPLIDRVNTELLPLVQPRISNDNTMDLIITLYNDGENIINPRIPNVPDIITITQYTELIDHNDRSKINKIKEILNSNNNGAD